MRKAQGMGTWLACWTEQTRSRRKRLNDHVAQPLGDNEQVLQESSQLNSKASQSHMQGGSRHM